MIPKIIEVPGDFDQDGQSPPRSLNREEFFSWLWQELSTAGLVGVHEGTVLSEEAAEKGFETDSWTLDSAQAPATRDWVGNQEFLDADLYFASQEEASSASGDLSKIKGLSIKGIREQEPQDWDAEWKASFLNAGNGVPILPFWRVVPPWVTFEPKGEKFIKINPGAGFGTGTHETTQLCLQALGEYSVKVPLTDQQVLDFGSGSGILSIAMAILGGRVDAVEVDSLAIDNSVENAQLNEVREQIVFAQVLHPVSADSVPQELLTYRYVVANILRPVLLEFAPQLVDRLQSGGVLVLSGLIESDVASVVERYSKLLGVPVTQTYSLGEWRALVFLRN
jgi:ribosomal protein L11 methyltransferase